MTTATYNLTGLHCGACVKRVTEALKPLADNVTVTLDPMQATLTEPHASVVQLQAAVAQAGKYALQPASTPILEEKVPEASLEYAQAAINTIAVKPTLPNVPAAAATLEAPKSWLATYYPLLLIISFILGGSVFVQVGQHAGQANNDTGLMALSGNETMRYFMAGFFIVFAFFKLLDVRAFADAYAGYDLLAARWQGWGLVYPFVELALGVAYLTHFVPALTHWATIIVMGFSAIGVILAVMNKTSIRCACLGSVFNLPMSTVTIVEDVGMVMMAIFMLQNI